MPDSHLSVSLVRADGREDTRYPGMHKDAYTTDVPFDAALLACQGQRLAEIVRTTVIGDPPRPGRRIIVLATSVPEPLECVFRLANGSTEVRSLRLRRLRVHATREPKDAPPFERLDGRVVRLRLRSLSPNAEEDMGRFVATAGELRATRAIMLDVRGNGGGSDRYVREWFVAFTSSEFSRLTTEQLKSEVTGQGALNGLTCALASKNTDAKARKSLTRSRDALATELKVYAQWAGGGPYLDWGRGAPPPDQGAAPARYRGALTVLVDAECASSCETLVRYARQIPGALIVGENTAGAGAFGEVLPYRLPESGIWIGVGSKWFHEEKAVQEGTGYLPDIWLDTADAVTATEAVALCLAEERCGTQLRAAVAHP